MRKILHSLFIGVGAICTVYQFTLTSEENIYIFTDGFADQFGGEPERKLTKKRFCELLLSLQNLSMHEQGTAFEKFIARIEMQQNKPMIYW